MNTHLLNRILYSLVSVPVLGLYLNIVFFANIFEYREQLNMSVFVIASISIIIAMIASFMFKCVYKIDFCISLRYFYLFSNIGFYAIYGIAIVSILFFSNIMFSILFFVISNMFYLFNLLILYFVCTQRGIPIKGCYSKRLVILTREWDTFLGYSFFHYDKDLSYNIREEVLLEGHPLLLPDLIAFEETFSKPFYNFSKEELTIVLMTHV